VKLCLCQTYCPGHTASWCNWLATNVAHQIYFLTQRKETRPSLMASKRGFYKDSSPPAEKRLWAVKELGGIHGQRFWPLPVAASRIGSSEIQAGYCRGTGGVGGQLDRFQNRYGPDCPDHGFFELLYSETGGPVGFDPKSP